MAVRPLMGHDRSRHSSSSDRMVTCPGYLKALSMEPSQQIPAYRSIFTLVQLDCRRRFIWAISVLAVTIQ